MGTPLCAYLQTRAADFHSDVLGWFDRWLRGDESGAEDLPDYRVFMQEQFNPTQANKPRIGRWIAKRNWPSAHFAARKVWLNDNGLGEVPQAAHLRVSTPADVGKGSGVFRPGLRIDNELAGHQRCDDALSVCFDLPPATALDLLGRHVLRIAFTADMPAAQIVARLCDVSPEGSSERISYRAVNLTHHAGNDSSEALVPGQRYTAEVSLNECAHHLRAGHRLRLALSNSYWPIVWPAPTLTKITLVLDECSLELPVRSVTDELDPCAPATPQSLPASSEETLRAADARASTFVQADGKIVQETLDDFGAARIPEHRMEVGSQVTTRYALGPDDPASAAFFSKWNFTFKRDDRQVAIDTENTMTRDARNFYLHRKLRAFEGMEQTEILSKEWSQTIPRRNL